MFNLLTRFSITIISKIKEKLNFAVFWKNPDSLFYHGKIFITFVWFFSRIHYMCLVLQGVHNTLWIILTQYIFHAIISCILPWSQTKLGQSSSLRRSVRLTGVFVLRQMDWTWWTGFILSRTGRELGCRDTSFK